MKLKTIGVLGGIGPQATMDFEQRVHRVARGRIPAHENNGYPPLVSFYHRRPPFVLTEDGSPRFPIQLDPDLERAATRIGAMSDFLVVTSNGAHLASGLIEKASGRPVLNMVDRTVDEARRRGWRTVGVITMGTPRVYQEPLEAAGLTAVTLDPAIQARLNPVILAFMGGDDSPAARQVAWEALADVRRPGVDGVILGCTEIPLLLGPRSRRRTCSTRPRCSPRPPSRWP